MPRSRQLSEPLSQQIEEAGTCRWFPARRRWCGSPVRPQRSITVRPRPGPGPRSTRTEQARVVKRSGTDQPRDGAGVVQWRAPRGGGMAVRWPGCRRLPCRHAPAAEGAPGGDAGRGDQRLGGEFQRCEHDRAAALKQDREGLRVAPGVEFGGGRDVALGPGAAHQHDLRRHWRPGRVRWSVPARGWWQGRCRSG